MPLTDTFRNLFYGYTQTSMKLIRYDDLYYNTVYKRKRLETI